MSEKHIKENKILTSAGKIICCCGEQINAVIKGDAEAMFFFLFCLYHTFRSRVLLFRGWVRVVGHFAVF